MNPIEIALNKPKEWEDNTLYPFITNKPQAFEAEILEVYQSNKVTRVKLYLKNVQTIIWGVFFVFTKWHKMLFFKGNRIYIRGEVKEYQIIQPKPIDSKKINKIIPLYKNKSIKKEIQKLSLKNLSLLPTHIAKTLYYMHFPRSIEDINLKKIEHALKWAEIFNYLYKMQSKKKYYPSKPIIANPTPFINSLPFKLTNDQLKAIKDIQNDISKNIQARRVIIGDVGSGKTIVMLAAAFMANKSIIMAPTSILANQIYQEAKKFLKNKKILLITQKTSPSKKEIQEANLLIGTHALLYKELPNVDIIMVDEQHRFGTNQRNKLEKIVSNKKVLPHYFQFSATPIPRTQALIMSSFVNVTLIKELPFKKEIETKIISKEDFKKLIFHIQSQISKGYQVAIVYPLVEDSDKFKYQSLESGKEFWLKHFKNVYITHGKDKNKEEVLMEFKDKGDILVTTTIIEVGISLPRLNTIVIVGAERLGLATLHQLRGRVGRYGDKGYCFLYTNDKNNPRLKAFASTLDGFKIAELDLKFRKSGDLLDGKVQSGESFKYFDETKDIKILEEVKEYLNLLADK